MKSARCPVLRIREKLKQTQAQFGHTVGLTQPMVSRIERGTPISRLAMLRIIDNRSIRSAMKRTGVSTDDLVRWGA